jgi:ankyrin repeat protein
VSIKRSVDKLAVDKTVVSINRLSINWLSINWVSINWLSINCPTPGVDIDVKNNDDMTALHLAAKNGHLDITQLLLEYN